MGVSMSTLGGWAIIFSIAGYYVYRYANESRTREIAKTTVQRQKVEDRQNVQQKKDSKEKAKRLRSEAYSKDYDDSEKPAKSKPRAANPAPAPAHNAVYSSDDGVDNREFARQLASVKAGTNFDGPKKNEQKKAKSVKQSRAREIDPVESRPSAPSSTAGVDADDDESSIPSPEVHAADYGDVSDMLEPKAAGPSVLRLTDTDKVKQKEKKAKAPEKVETKKQRQNRQKAEAAKAAKEEAEKDRLVALEAQRRLARISEGRAAKDGSAFMAAQKQDAWKDNGANGAKQQGEVSNGDASVQPLDTFSSAPKPQTSTAPVAKAPVAKAATKAPSSDAWMSSLPSEEEQLEQLLADEEWNTVTTKKSSKSKKKDAPAADEQAGASAVSAPQQVAPVVSKPPVAKPQKPSGGKPALGQQSSFAALSTEEPEEVEEEWDV